jgi:hypothetical protein
MRCWVLAAVLFASIVTVGIAEESEKKKHHRRHHHKHHKAKGKSNIHSVAHANAADKVHESKDKSTVAKKSSQPSVTAHLEPKSKPVSVGSSEEDIVNRMKTLEADLATKEKSAHVSPTGPPAKLEVNGPLPYDFADRFSKAVAKATGGSASEIRVITQSKLPGVPGDVREIQFAAPPKIVEAVQDQAADPDSKLAAGNLHSFLVAHDDDDEPAPQVNLQAEESPEETPVKEDGIDIDTAMPYGELEPFGREDTAQELTEQSVKESDEMVDQLERAEVAEEKRAVFRALTRLRGAAITSFDGIARSQTGNIDEYNKLHKWRRTHPLHHLADEESDISKWAFPDNADF